MGCADRRKRRHPRRGSGEEQSQFWERWVTKTESFSGKVWLEKRDKATADSAEPQRDEAEVKVLASKHRVFFP